MNEYQDNGWMKELKAETDKYDMLWPAEGAQTYKVQHAAKRPRFRRSNIRLADEEDVTY